MLVKLTSLKLIESGIPLGAADIRNTLQRRKLGGSDWFCGMWPSIINFDHWRSLHVHGTPENHSS